MEYVNVTTQAELDAAVAKGDIPICRDGFFSVAFDSATVRAFGSATVEASGSATVRAFGSATVRAYDSATVEASGSATVEASGSATVEASGSATVEAFGSATVEASGSATVRAFDSATVRAFDSATVRAFGSATVRASGSATVQAFDSATVRAFGSATVEASGSATVEASGSATVEAYGNATVRAYGNATVQASKYVAIHRFGGTPIVNGGVLIQVPTIDSMSTWMDYYGIEENGGKVIVYKAVDDTYTSGHNFTYPIGTEVTCNDWNNTSACGNGLHFSPRPFMALKYNRGPKFIACEVAIADSVCIDEDKIKSPSCKVLYECDIDGNVISSPEPVEAKEIEPIVIGARVNVQKTTVETAEVIALQDQIAIVEFDDGRIEKHPLDMLNLVSI